MNLDGREVRFVLDASALLALMQGEDGADEVEAILDGAAMSAVNLSETLQKGEQKGIETEGLELDLPSLGVEIRPFDVIDARTAADLWPETRGAGLSLGDRACLALAASLGATAVTADRRWRDVTAAPVRVIR